MALEEKFEDERTIDAGMDESIRATLREINSRNASEPAEPASEEPAAEVSAETPETTERARDEKGQFAKAPKESAATAKAATPEKPVEAAGTEPVAAEPEKPLVTTTGQPIDINRPPSAWKPAAKAAWTALPEPVRQEIYRRETDFMHGQKGMRENADFGQEIKATLEPYRMLIESEGGTPARAIADTMRTAALFRVGTPQQKMAALYQIDKQFNCGFEAEFQRLVAEGIAKATGQAVAPAAQPAADPRIDQLIAEREAERRSRFADEQRLAQSATQQFYSSLDEKGQPKYPFIANVESEMVERVKSLRAANPGKTHNEILEQAYTEAVWANPETRAVLIAQQQAQANQQAETQKRVEQAKRASAVNVPKRGAIPATGPAKSLDDTIRETAQALGMF